MITLQNPIQQRCSLADCFEVTPGGVPDWRAMERFHYRSSRCGAVDRVFTLRWKTDAVSNRRKPSWCDADEPVGVIVIAMPLVSVAMRNRATHNRYVGLTSRSSTLRLINHELRSISRVVIHPQYRGIGLAARLVRYALPRAGTVMVEAMAAMGQVNPFFERAGMTRYDGNLSPSSVRLLAAMEQVDIKESLIADPSELMRTIHAFDANRRQWLIQEMTRFAQAYGKWARKIAEQVQKSSDDDRFGQLIHLVSSHALLRPVYYLWRSTAVPSS